MKKNYYLCTRKTDKGGAVQKHNAEIAQLVEHNLAKVGVASSSLVFRSKSSSYRNVTAFLLLCIRIKNRFPQPCGKVVLYKRSQQENKGFESEAAICHNKISYCAIKHIVANQLQDNV